MNGNPSFFNSPARRAFLALALLGLLAVFAIIFSLFSGSLSIAPTEVLRVLVGAIGANEMTNETASNDSLRTIILELRLPRVLGGFAVGGLLAFSGALLQILLRNPLADPYVLGVSGGASVGATLALFLGVSASLVSGFAFLGAFIAMLLVFSLAQSAKASKSGAFAQSRLLLTGVIIASGCGAIVALLLSLAPDQQMKSMLFWLMGDLTQSGDPFLMLAILSALLLISLAVARDLNLLARGDITAKALGVSVSNLRFGIYLAASLATAFAVSNAGAIGFVGLIVPHMIRLLLGNDQRFLLPATALLGGSLLVIADTFSRTIIAPQQLPVGVLTAFIGVPVFLFLLTREKR